MKTVLLKAWAASRLFKWRKVGDRAVASTDGVQMFRLHFLRLAWPRGKWKGIRIGLHKIVRPDNLSKGLHDHPWDFWSIVLRGGYTERYAPDWLALGPDARDPDRSRTESWFRTRTRGWLSTSFHLAEYAHAILALKNGRPCWTFFVSSNRVRDWGFPQVGEVVAHD